MKSLAFLPFVFPKNHTFILSPLSDHQPLKEASAIIITMYPRVKVRLQEEHDDQFKFEKRSLQSLKAPEILSSNDFSSPDDAPTSVVRVPKLDSSGALDSWKQKVLEQNRTNIRVTPVLRPRAVLSSPDNDQMIGSKNKMRGVISCPSKNGSFSSRHAKCKVIPGSVAADGSLSMRGELKEVAVSKGVSQSRQRAAVADPTLSSNHRKGKPKSVQDRTLGDSPTNKE